MERMKDGLGSKVPILVQSVSLLLSGLAVGFFTNWRLTLVLMVSGPILVAISGYTAKVSEGNIVITNRIASSIRLPNVDGYIG